MPKSPFERIFSLTERRKILSKAVQDKSAVVVKSVSQKIAQLKVEAVDLNLSISGKNPNLSKIGFRDFEKVTILLYQNNDKYFINGKIKLNQDQWTLVIEPQFYRLNRRNSFRILLPEKIDLNFQINQIRNIEVNKQCRLLEFSTGGCRVVFPSEMKLSNGSIVKGFLQFGPGKILSINALVVHSPKPRVFGFKFINLNSVTLNRLKMQSIEIQQAIHFG